MARIYKIENEIPNPQGVGASGWSATTAFGGSASVIAVIDPELGPCIELSATAPGGFTEFPAVYPSAHISVPFLTTELVYVAAMVKHISGPTAKVNLSIEWHQGGPSLLSAVTVDLGDAAVARRLEGFAVPDLPVLTGFVRFSVGVLGIPPGQTAVYRVAQPHLQINPWGDVPAYCDGDQPNCVWTGAPHASRSTGTKEAGVPGGYGFNDHTIVNGELTIADNVRLHRQLSSRIVRFGMSEAIATQAQPSAGEPINWQATSVHSWFEEMRQKGLGLKLAPALGTPTAWMGGTKSLADLPASDYDDLAALYAAFVTEYRDLLAWTEFYNEPNLGFFWGFPDSSQLPDATKYTDILKVYYPAVKAAAPELPVVGGSLSHIQTTQGGGFASVSLEDFLEGMYAAGAKDFMDALSVHPYPAGTTTAGVTPVGDFGAGYAAVMDQVRTIRDTSGDIGKLIYITECGLATANERSHAFVNSLIRGIAMRQPDVGGFIVHTITEDPETGFEVVRLPTQTFRSAAEVLAA